MGSYGGQKYEQQIDLRGVDGTSIETDVIMRKPFLNSHVHNLFRTWSHGPAEYMARSERSGHRADISTETPGPDNKGLSSFPSVGPYRRGPVNGESRILAGYSRVGGFRDRGMQMAEGLFDPGRMPCFVRSVDRSLGCRSARLTTRRSRINVKNVIHVVRDPRLESRESFGNCVYQTRKLDQEPKDVYRYLFGHARVDRRHPCGPIAERRFH
jgi:hypothetical protein